jgi:hypothetical protein
MVFYQMQDLELASKLIDDQVTLAVYRYRRAQTHLLRLMYQNTRH